MPVQSIKLMPIMCCAVSHRSQLGLRPMSAEDEEVVKLLLYGNEAQGLTGERTGLIRASVCVGCGTVCECRARGGG
jgi:hypothetical protein